MSLLRRTRSLCPCCLRVIDARYVATDVHTVHLEKTCPEHGPFRVPAWVTHEGDPGFTDWRASIAPSIPAVSARPLAPLGHEQDQGCPFACGLCPEHGQRTCCALLEVTSRCNLRCPVCYAAAGQHTPDPDLPTLQTRLRALKAQAGQANVQLSGGEPTLRDDLPALIRLVKAEGFAFVQVNTNGLRLGCEPGYAQSLKEAGLDLVYLQWDGLRSETCQTLRGTDCLPDKHAALARCREAGLPVLLVATVVAGVNLDELGALLRFAFAAGPLVRGLHLQPAASFGRFYWSDEAAPRLTLPELMRALEEQSHGLVHASDFHAPTSEHALCSFSALYNRRAHGLELLPRQTDGCCQPEAAQQARDMVARHWGASAPNGCCSEKAHNTQGAQGVHGSDGFDAFLARSSLHQRFTLSAMAFQDAHSLDLERVRRCHVHVITPDLRLVPFCLYNLTASGGEALHRGR